MERFVLTTVKTLVNNNMERRILLRSIREDATEFLGKIIGERLTDGDLVVLDGDLGAGKTVITRGIALGMGLEDRVASPTYTIVREYGNNSELKLFHFDVYRLEGEEDFVHSGLDEYFGRSGVCVIEWGLRIASILPDERLSVLFSGRSDSRDIEIIATSRYFGLLDQVCAHLDLSTGLERLQ